MQLLPFTLVLSTLIPCLFVGIQYPSLSQTILWWHVSIINSKDSKCKNFRRDLCEKENQIIHKKEIHSHHKVYEMTA